MPARTRQRTPKRSGSGYHTSSDNSGFNRTITISSRALETELCSDTTMFAPYVTPHDLLIEKKTVKPITVSGSTTLRLHSSPSYYLRYEMSNAMWNVGSSLDNCPVRPTPTWSKYLTMALARLNPNAQTPVDYALFAYELREFPRMLRNAGRYLRGEVGSSDIPGSFLEYSFGWAPLLSDLRSMLNFADSWDSRLRRLYQAGKDRRISGTLESSKDDSLSTTLAYSYQIHASRDISCRIERDRRAWFVATLRPKSGFPRSERKFIEQFRSASANSQFASTVWNSLPWSWLIDYFGNIGDFINAHRGQLPYDVVWVNIMYKSVDTKYYSMNYVPFPDTATAYYDHKLEVVTDGYCRTECKQRKVYGSPSPKLAFDIGLTRFQTSILGALLLARLPNRGR